MRRRCRNGCSTGCTGCWPCSASAAWSFRFSVPEARWLLLSFVVTIIATMALGMSVGWNKLWGVTHLIFWTPVVVYYIKRWPQIEKKSVYGVWFVAALATMIVSLVFDAKDLAEYLMGV